MSILRTSNFLHICREKLKRFFLVNLDIIRKIYTKKQFFRETYLQRQFSLTNKSKIHLLSFFNTTAKLLICYRLKRFNDTSVHYLTQIPWREIINSIISDAMSPRSNNYFIIIIFFNYISISNALSILEE